MKKEKHFTKDFNEAYNYDDVKLTCPFCKSEMMFLAVLVDDLKLPHYVDYFCTNDRCSFDLRIVWEDFEKRIKKMSSDECFIEGINIIAKYIPNGSDYNFAAEHDKIYYGEYSWVTDKKDIKRLDKLGWFEDEESWAFFV